MFRQYYSLCYRSSEYTSHYSVRSFADLSQALEYTFEHQPAQFTGNPINDRGIHVNIEYQEVNHLNRPKYVIKFIVHPHPQFFLLHDLKDA